MPKRYAFYRQPETGRPYRSQNDVDVAKHAPTEVLAQYGKASCRGAEGNVGWSNLVPMQFEPVLRAAIVVIDPDGKELSEIDAWNLVHAGLTEMAQAAPGQSISPVKLLRSVDRLAGAYFHEACKPYVLITSLSVKSFPTEKILLRNCEIFSEPNPRAKYPLPSILASACGKDLHDHAELMSNSKYLPMAITLEARTVHSAVEKALATLSLLRGLWSLIATAGKLEFSLFGGGVAEAIGVIHNGIVHTLHYPDGKSVNDHLYWYNANYSKDKELFGPRNGWTRLEAARLSCMEKITNSRFGGELEDLLIRYAEALDQSNNDLAFLQLWGILERTTGTVGKAYDDTIKRTAWLFGDSSRLIVKESLNWLRFRRNQYVHSGQSGDRSEQIARMLKTFVDQHLLFLIENPLELNSMEEYAQALSLPTDLAKLEADYGIYGRALKLRKKPPDKEE